LTYPAARNRRRRGPSYGGGSGGSGVCSGASPALLHLDPVANRYYTRTDGQIGVTSHPFADLLTFTGPAGRTYVNAAGRIVTAGLNVPRIENYIDTGSGLFNAGQLFESEARTNLIIRSEEFDLWGGGGAVTVTTNTHISPDGNMTADTLTSGGGSTDFLIRSGVASDGQVKSMYARTVSGTGTVAILGHNSVGAALTTLTEEWQRFDLPVDTAETGGTNFYAVDFRAGDLTEIVVWGAQLETGENPSSYIETEAAAVTLAGETMQIDPAVLQAALGVTMPAALSGAMSTYITYADLNAANQVTIYDHRADANNRMTVTLSTDGASTGLFTLTMVNGGVSASVSAPVQIMPGTNVAANVAWYADAAGINIAVNGSAATEVATAIGLPNLIGADVDLATDFNGSILHTTITADNLEVAGIQDATTTGSGFNPLCPFD